MQQATQSKAANKPSSRARESHSNADGVTRSRELGEGIKMRWGADCSATAEGCFHVRFLVNGRWAEQGSSGLVQLRQSGCVLIGRGDALKELRSTCVEAYQVALEIEEAKLRALLQENEHCTAAEIETRLHDAEVMRLPLTPNARFNAESLRRCPFAGSCRELSLTARGLDLLAELLAALAQSCTSIEAPAHLPLEDTLAQVRQAGELLEESLDEPPTIAELAQRVRLSESTLKRGFRQVYGTSPFAHLRSLRMGRARDLLSSGKASVLEAAAYVGYSNPSHFATAFRRAFGVNPKTFQMATHR